MPITDMFFLLQSPRRRSLKRNLIPQINLASSFFPAIPRWREKSQKWLLWPELHIKWEGLNDTPVFISGWNWGSTRHCYPYLYPQTVLSMEKIAQGAQVDTKFWIPTKQQAASWPTSFTIKIHLTNRQMFLVYCQQNDT